MVNDEGGMVICRSEFSTTTFLFYNSSPISVALFIFYLFNDDYKMSSFLFRRNKMFPAMSDAVTFKYEPGRGKYCRYQISIKTPNPKCHLCWCLMEFVDWSHVGIFDPFCELAPI
jgi:hypothetical protein